MLAKRQSAWVRSIGEEVRRPTSVKTELPHSEPIIKPNNEEWRPVLENLADKIEALNRKVDDIDRRVTELSNRNVKMPISLPPPPLITSLPPPNH